MPDLNYERDIAIDCEALDVEWVQQPELMRRYANHMADTKRDMDDAKERLDVMKAQLDREIRADPSKFGLDKLTESAVQSTILLQREYTDASKVYSDARYEYDIAGAAVRALDQKKTALENLVRLLAASYFAGPQAPRDLSKQWIEHTERGESNARVRMARTRKKASHSVEKENENGRIA